MTRQIFLAGAAFLFAASAANAQTEPPEGDAPPQETTPGRDASQSPRTASGDVLTYEPDFFAASNPNTAQDMVSRVPGFSIDNGDNVRGFAGSAGNVLINGARPASKSDSASDVLGRTPASRVVRIELIRGSAPGIDMEGHPVVVNVILSEEASRQHTLTARTIIFERGPTLYGGRYEFAASEGETSWGARFGRGIGYNDSTGYGVLTRRDAAGNVILVEALERGFNSDNWNGGADWTGPVGPGTAEITASAGTGSFDNLDMFRAEGAGGRVFESGNNDLYGDLGLRYEGPATDRLTLTGRLIQELGQYDGSSSARVAGTDQLFAYDEISGESIGRIEGRFQRSEALTLESTAEIAYNFLDTEQSFAVNGAAVPLPNDTVKVEELRGEVSARAVLQAMETLSLEGGVRLEKSRISQSGGANDERDFFYPKPRLAATWTPSEGHQFRARIERELGQLNFGDFAASTSLTNDQVFGGNVNLQPEQRWVAELSYERRFWGDGALTLTVRHDEIKDVIDTIPLAGGLSAVGNIGDGTQDQLDVNLRLPLDRFGLPNARFEVEATLIRSRVSDPTTGARREISDVRPFDATINFEQDIPSWNLTYGVFALPRRGSESFNPDQRTFFEVHNYLQAYVEYTISPGFTVEAEVTRWDDFRTGRDVYADRQTRAIDFRERRRIDPREFVQLSVRKQF